MINVERDLNLKYIKSPKNFIVARILSAQRYALNGTRPCLLRSGVINCNKYTLQPNPYHVFELYP